MFGKALLTSRETMISSIWSMWVTVSWRRMPSCADRPEIAPQRVAGMSGSRWGLDAAQEDGPDDLDLRHCTHYGVPVVRPSPPFL